ncbi:oocyte zinc finger -like [Pelobates cultripes]|uniref:Oocyte zinc finger -like n=1 Tax=Pelobates cultripes TaxID=61616 RepID=A0AAD1T7X5_PELCU|nr:oocyte zinc finger -like [Pelobates cultripes]
MNKVGTQKTEKILDLTLEMIYLLIGEDYIVVKKPGECSPHVSDGSSKIQSPITLPPHHSLIYERNNEKMILELTNQIIRLLTGEVPIRCEDVTVHLSMEEWEYLEGHKDLYKDVMKNHQPLSSSGMCGLHGLLGAQGPGSKDLRNRVKRQSGCLIDFHKPGGRGSLRPLEWNKCPANRIHTGEKMHSCPECGKCFNRKPELVKHQRIHTGEKPYVCSECGKCFRDGSHLWRHKRIHTGQNPYQCSECSKSFNQKSHLSRHQLIHTDEKPFSCSELLFHCSECGKGFTQKSALTSHLRIHTGEKPYCCSECGKCFAQMSSLYVHLKRQERISQKSQDLLRRPHARVKDRTRYVGENYLIVKISHESVKYSSNLHVSEESCRTQSPSTVLPPHSLIQEGNNDQNILELTNQIIHLLTGEVPIRCEDIAVYFSTEEWEYLEGHKDLYKDVMMENDQTLSSLDCVSEDEENSTLSPGTKCTKKSQTVGNINEKSASLKEENVTNTDISTHTEDAMTEHISVHIKEELFIHDNRNLTVNGIYIPIDDGPTEYISTTIKEELSLHDNGNITVNGLYIPTDDGPTEYISTTIKEELSLHDNGNLTVNGNYIPTDDGPTEYISTTIKEEFSPYSEENIEDLYEQGEHIGCVIEKSSLLEDENVLSTGLNTLTDHSSQPGYTFNQRRDLSAIHGEDCLKNTKLYSCSECNKCFTRSANLAVHWRTHTGERPYSCSRCGKGFRHRPHLIIHERIHTGEKPFSCSECGKCFIDRSRLFRHRMIHTGEKPYSCSLCGKGFIHKPHLAIHERIHTGDKPYSCAECGKCYSDKSNLFRHQKTHAKQCNGQLS